MNILFFICQQKYGIKINNVTFFWGNKNYHFIMILLDLFWIPDSATRIVDTLSRKKGVAGKFIFA